VLFLPRPHVLVFSVLIALAALLLPSPAASAGIVSRENFVTDTNRARVNHDLRAYRVRDGMTRVAQRWAEWMARHRTIRHNPYLSSQIGNWRALGENVGAGRSEDPIQRAFMRSSPHRANILSRTYTQVGIGTARGSDGRLYVDEVFRRPS
jgi:uncharacterized protein YkwD